MTVRIVTGDCRPVLATLPPKSVHCVVTSPPYFGLRDYGTGTWEGGDPQCAHRVGNQVPDQMAPDAIKGGVRPGCDASRCGRSGATRVDSQIGLETTPAEYVAEIVSVFREVRRVLRDDGTVWLNLGDSYASSPRGNRAGDHSTSSLTNPRRQGHVPRGSVNKASIIGLKKKDLIGIPWAVAFALRDDGWYLRQDIIWSKPNPMPESVDDRCTKSHEYLFLLTKRPRYFYDAEAIAETSIHSGRVVKASGSAAKNGQKGVFGATAAGFTVHDTEVGATRNKRSVWTVNSAPFAGAHFATFPPDLIEPCILAGSPKGGTVLDPFFGAGTTGLVSDRLGRDCIGIELNPQYAAMATERLHGDAGMFAEVAA